MSDEAWKYKPGDVVVRTDLHNDYGGGRQGGISPSRQTPNVLLFTDPATGQQHGYYDGWDDDGCFHYTGEGQSGDQQMTRGNRALLDHQTSGRAIRLFKGTGGPIVYLGEFCVANDPAWYTTDAPATGDPEPRKVIVFRLQPVGEVSHQPEDALPAPVPGAVELVPVESINTEAFAGRSSHTAGSCAVVAFRTTPQPSHANLTVNGGPDPRITPESGVVIVVDPEQVGQRKVKVAMFGTIAPWCDTVAIAGLATYCLTSSSWNGTRLWS